MGIQNGWASSQEKIGSPVGQMSNAREALCRVWGAQQVARPRPAPNHELRYGFELNSAPRHYEQ